MRNKAVWFLAVLILALVFYAGYEFRSGILTTNGGGVPLDSYFKTQFQEESQFIVEAIVTDLAEQVFYAKNHRLPDPKVFSVHAIEKAGPPLDQPVFAVSVAFAADRAPLQTDLKIDGPIWAPEVYGDIVAQLVRETGADAPAAGAGGRGDSSLLDALANASASTLENEDKKVSEALEADFKNPLLHEEAALILGVFALREHSGAFYDIRSPLCRITAHLAMSRYLNGTTPVGFPGPTQKNQESNVVRTGLNGQMAEVILLTLMNDQAPALKELDMIEKKDPAVIEWAGALQGFITGDYRALAQVKNPSPIERIAWFRAYGISADLNVAWNALTGDEKKLPDFARLANELNYSVETGHDLLRVSVTLDVKEASTVHDWSQGGKLTSANMVEELNRLPERCFTPDDKGNAHVRVIGWGQWAMFFQRQLGHSLKSNFDFLQNHWGVPDQAAQFSAQADKTFTGMRLYPFVRRFNCTDQAAYHSSVDDSFKITVACPQFVPAECWNNLCYDGPGGENYKPNPNPHINEWHKHNPPPGTAYNMYPRTNHPSLTNRPDAGKVFAELHKLAPYDLEITGYIQRVDYKDHPTYEQAEALYRELLPFNVHAMVVVAGTLRDQPARYEEIMAKASELCPAYYFVMGDCLRTKGEDDKAAGYFEKGSQADPDALMAASYAEWLVHYYLGKGQPEKARAVADAAGEVYSEAGLQAKGEYFEATGDYPQAFEWFSKIEERYNETGPLIGFCFRYKNKTGDGKYDGDLQSRAERLFPKGLEKAGIGDFKSPPTDGVLISGVNDLALEAGLQVGDVITAVDGVRVHNFKQYVCSREFGADPDLHLIVWRNGYSEIKASPHDHVFGEGAVFVDYAAK